MTKPRKRRFFFHYHRGKKKMSVHFLDTCHVVDNIICHAKVETKYNKRQPFLVLQGFAHEVTIENSTATIN